MALDIIPWDKISGTIMLVLTGPHLEAHAMTVDTHRLVFATKIIFSLPSIWSELLQPL